MFFFSSRRRHTRYWRDWSSDVCSSDLKNGSILNLQPVFQCSSKELLSATLLTTFQYSGMEFLLLVHPYFKNKDKVGKSIFGALFIMTIIYTWIEIGRASCRDRV